MPLEERPCEGAEGLGGEAAAARVEVARAVPHIQPARAPLALEARGVELPPSKLRVTHLHVRPTVTARDEDSGGVARRRVVGDGLGGLLPLAQVHDADERAVVEVVRVRRLRLGVARDREPLGLRDAKRRDSEDLAHEFGQRRAAPQLAFDAGTQLAVHLLLERVRDHLALGHGDIGDDVGTKARGHQRRHLRKAFLQERGVLSVLAPRPLPRGRRRRGGHGVLQLDALHAARVKR
mmetsp:Transcript_59990/g.144156  ORF Transcript_59990/g.144156 Transcript_59990/m.144156 type:complete len:236 (+) Transcript_59990:629-1336(+)